VRTTVAANHGATWYTRKGRYLKMTGTIIYLLISGFLGFCGFVDALHQPSAAWHRAGKSKVLWVLITFVGMITVLPGWITWAVYSYGGTRKAVVRNGGFNRPAPPKTQGHGCGSCTDGAEPCPTCTSFGSTALDRWGCQTCNSQGVVLHRGCGGRFRPRSAPHLRAYPGYSDSNQGQMLS
jgi:hypothetical protein